MKHQRFLLKIVVAAFTGMITYSCIDDSYDLSNISKKMELFGNSLAVPVGTTTIYMDSVIGGLGVDSTILSWKDGKYVFSYAGTMDMSGLTSSLGDFTLSAITPVANSVDLFDATLAPSEPYNIPSTTYSYYGTTSIALPSFNTSLISVDSIELQNTILRITLGSENLQGPKLNESIRIDFTAQGTGADYYIAGDPVTSWTIHMGETCDLEIRKLRLSGGSGSLSLAETVTMAIAAEGDVQAIHKAKTRMNLSMSVLNGMDFNVVYGRVDYQMNGTLDPINFDALGSILGENDVLSFYNPSINLSTTGNLGVPVNFTMNMGTFNSTTGQSRSLTNTTFSLNPATSPSVPITNTKTFDKDNGTAELFKINPDQITMGYSFETDKNSLKNHFIAKNSQMTMNYNMEIPLQFGGDLHLGMGTTMESPIGDLSIMADQENLSVGLTLNVKNRIPLALKLKLTALDEDSLALFSTESDTIQAAGPIDPITGFATGYTITNTDLTLTPAQIDQLQPTKKFRVSFVITSNNQASFVTVQPSDYIEIKIGAQIEGGVLLDLDNLPDN